MKMQSQTGSNGPRRGVGALLHDVTSWFVPASLLHSATHRGMAQIFVQSHLLAAFAASAMVVYLADAAGTDNVALFILGASVVVFAALPFILRQTGNMSLVTFVSFQTMTVASLAGIFDYGGLGSPFLPWLLVSLMSGLFYLSRRVGLVLGIFALDVATFFAVVLLGAPEALSPDESLRLLSWVSIAVAMTYMAFMALYYARIIASRAELELEAERYRTASIELEQARAMAEKVNRDRSQFLSKMSHELRTPLNAVINYSEILLEDCEDSPDRGGQRMADLKRINATGRHLLSLVSDVFDVEHLEDESVAVDVSTSSLGDLCDAVTASAQPLVERNGNRLVIDCPLRTDVVSTDVKKLRQMLLNLLSNAAKFTSNGTVTLELWVERGLADDRLHAAVKDNGIGIEPQTLPKLFETYIQADASIYSRYGGTGMGLALTRKFSVLLGGEIRVTSAPGQGSCFTIDIPADLKVRAAQSRQEEAPVAEAGNAPPGTKARAA
jgi:signal transduction histidine kinase